MVTARQPRCARVRAPGPERSAGAALSRIIMQSSDKDQAGLDFTIWQTVQNVALGMHNVPGPNAVSLCTKSTWNI